MNEKCDVCSKPLKSLVYWTKGFDGTDDIRYYCRKHQP